MYMKGRRAPLLYVIPLILISLCGIAHADEITLTSCDWEPYTGENMPGYGFTAEIIDRAMKRVGHKVTFVFYPWKRAVYETKKGRVHGAFSAYHSKERAETFALSEPYAFSQLMLCAKKGREVIYNSIEDLRPYRIGVVAGYANTAEIDGAHYLTKDEAPSDLLNIKKLLTNRVDLIVVDRYVAVYHVKNSAAIEYTVNDIDFIEPPLKKQPIYIMFSRAVPGYQRYVADFNKGLELVKADGSIGNIMEKYGFFNQ